MRAVSLPSFRPVQLFTPAIAIAGLSLVVLAIALALGMTGTLATDAVVQPLDLPFRW
ncbi:MAG TPA: hypothetical protein VIK08_01775 [Candidatus Limnocylindrales bacterium]